MQALPKELLAYIGSNNNTSDFISLLSTNMKFYQLINELPSIRNKIKIDNSYDLNTLLCLSIINKDYLMISMIANKFNIDNTLKLNISYETCIRLINNDSRIFKILLDNNVINSSENNNYAVRYASDHGYLEIVKLLLSDERVDPSDSGNYAIRLASYNGHLEIVKLLLSDERVDPSAVNNSPIRYASEHGHLEIVKLLLLDERVDPSADNNFAIRLASSEGHFEIVKLLLADARVGKLAYDSSV